ncbi:hypothetical protein [Hahella ganghwensis]|uniref:hypothetical protein n=1 Tax=Hahella ganghwensis TaxID=286420 RepID=UPI0003740ABC|nr:hypothetical protein [Hahella ganghwensis]
MVSYKRVSAQNGQFPTLDSYFDYLYMLKNGKPVSGPENFNSIKEFYNHLDKQVDDNTMRNKIEEMKSNKVLISLAPSACQDEAKSKGFHVVTFTRNTNTVKFSPSWEKYQFDGTRFISECQV